MIRPLFSTPLYKSKFIRAFNQKEIDAYKSVYENKTKNVKNLIGTCNRALDEIKDFSEIREFIQVHLNQYTYQVYGMKMKHRINITTSWLNLTKPGMSHHHHTHPNSLVSGVFYFQTIPNDSISFLSPLGHSISPFLFSFDNSLYLYDSVQESVKDGELILFPSWLRHEVLENKSDQDRISLAFNTFPSGNFLNHIDVSNLEIKH